MRQGLDLWFVGDGAGPPTSVGGSALLMRWGKSVIPGSRRGLCLSAQKCSIPVLSVVRGFATVFLLRPLTFGLKSPLDRASARPGFATLLRLDDSHRDEFTEPIHGCLAIARL